MRVSFNQPAFIPWGGFFARLQQSDLMILLDDTQFARGFTYVNRNHLKGPSGEIWITVPIKKKGLGQQMINQLKIFQSEKFSKNFLALLRHYYGHSVYFDSLYPKLSINFEYAKDNFLALILSTLNLLKGAFGLKTPFLLQSETGLRQKGARLLIELAKAAGATEVLLPNLIQRHLDLREFTRAGLKIFCLKYNQYPYPQFWGEFLGNLSAVDLFLCLGPEGRQIIEKSTKVVSPEC
ncbi:MAG: WbqC family protein [Candidatus Saccharicenans sp.]